MSDDIIQQATEAIYTWFLDGRTLWSREMTKVHARNLAQDLADAGLLPTETEWGRAYITRGGELFVDDQDGSFRDAEDVAQFVKPAHAASPYDLVVTRNVTPWKDAS